jgi:NTE family protein
MTTGSCTPALVLSGGGARGAYQVGVLREIARQHPELGFPVLTGVSAGAINAAYLASQRSDLADATESLARLWSGLSTSAVMRTDVFSLLGNALRIVAALTMGGSRLAPSARGLVDTKPLGKLLDRLVDPEEIDANIREGSLEALGVSATSYRSGDSITFVQGRPGTEMWSRHRRRSRLERIGAEHVLASTAIPLFFPARAVNGEYFGDGSLRQAYPLSPAVHLGADRILAISSRYVSASPDVDPDDHAYPSTARILGLVLNSIFLDQLDADAERLESVNQLLSHADPKHRWLLSDREVEILVIRPSQDIGRMARWYERDLPLALRHLIRGLGTRKGSGSDLLSYLLFVPEFLADLIRLGERDATLNRVRIARFVEGCTGARQEA